MKIACPSCHTEFVSASLVEAHAPHCPAEIPAFDEDEVPEIPVVPSLQPGDTDENAAARLPLSDTEPGSSSDPDIPAEQEPSEKPARRRDSEPAQILRFRASERAVHWAIAIPFLVCYTTATILVIFYNPDPQRPLRWVFSWIHRTSAICFILLPPLVVFRSRGDFRIHLYNIRQAWRWTLSDVSWLFRMGLAMISSRFGLPEQGKFNAAEKLNFMMVMTTYPLYIFTGILMWLPGIAFVSWILHFFMALLATPFLVGHIFMATLNPSTRIGLQGMLSGFVDRQWAKHHYGGWYRENFEAASTVTETAPRESRKVGGPSDIVSGREDDAKDGERSSSDVIQKR